MRNLFFAFILLPLFFQAQDLIVMKTGITIPSLVLEVSQEIVRYKRHSNLDGPDYTVKKSGVSYIQYKNGTKENIDSLYQIGVASGVNGDGYTGLRDAASMYEKGEKDARVFYNTRCGAVGTGITAFACGCFGLIPAIICSSKSPKTENLKYPNSELWGDPNYRRGYEHRAKKIKQKKVWTGFGIGFVAGAVVSLAIYSSQ